MTSRIARVDTTESARVLAAWLNNPGRGRPVAVVSTPAGRTAPYIDAESIQEQLGDLAEVYLLPTGDVSWAFSQRMPEMTQVYGGAGRVYPIGVGWIHAPYESPLRFAFNEREGDRSTQAMIVDALSMAAISGLASSTSAVPTRTVSGTVRSVVAGRAIVRLDNGQLAWVVEELVVPGVHIDRILTKGMTVSGALDDAGRLDIRPILCGADALPYRFGDVVLARVDEVAASSARLALHPRLAVEVPREAVTTNDLDDLDILMTRGEVLRVRVVGTSPWEVCLRDLEDYEEAIPAFALVPGGPSWLLEGLPEVEPDDEPESPVRGARPCAAPPAPDGATAADLLPDSGPDTLPVPRPPLITPAILDRRRARGIPRSPVPEVPAARAPAIPGAAFPTPTAPTPTAPTPTAPTPTAPASALPRQDLLRIQAERTRALDEARSARAETEGLRRELQLVVEDRVKARNRVRHLEDELARARQKLRVTRRKPASPDGGPWFTDDEEQFRYDVQTAWVHRIPAGEKDHRPLPPYAVGSAFLASVHAMQGISRAKIVDVVVEVLTGLAARQPGREVHPLRASDGGDSAPRTRGDGAICWRVSLQVHTPSARRLHYWQLPDKSIELSRIVIHDDVDP